MTRISIYVLSSVLAAIALSGNCASAGSTLTLHTSTPTVNIRTPSPKLTLNPSVLHSAGGRDLSSGQTVVRPMDAAHRLPRGKSGTAQQQLNPNAIGPPR